MRLLLDTRIFLWGFLDPDRLTDRVASELEARSNELWLSHISAWEVMILAEKGRVVLRPDPVAWLRKALNTIPYEEAPVTHEVAVQSRLVSLPHQDPADRFIVATAVVYDLTLVTSDARILDSGSCATLPNRRP